MDNDSSDAFKSLFGTPTSASELFHAGTSNPGYVPSNSDLGSFSALQSLLAGQDSAKKSDS